MAVLFSQLRSARSSESGLGLIEIVISMFLLALLAIAILPLLINSLQLGPKNAAVAAGNQLVADGLTQAGAQGLVSCSSVRSLASTFPAEAGSTTSATEYGITLAFVPGACPPGPVDYPGTVEVTVSAVQHAGTADEAALAEARQLIYVVSP